MKASRNVGFTLIELIVVIAVIALLSSIVLAALTQARMRSRDTARIANANQITLALHMHEVDKGTYQVAGGGYQNTGAGYMAKSTGDPNYTTSILSLLKSSGYYTADTINDPVYGDANYFLGVCTTTKAYNLYLKLEQPTLMSAQSDLLSGCDGANAVALGFNFIEGLGLASGGATSTGGGGGGGGGGTTAIALGATGSSASAGVATSSSQISLLTANVASVGSGTYSALPQALANVANSGSHTLQRPDGKYLIISGNGFTTNIYDPIADTFTAGPSVTYSVSGGAFSLRRPDGKFAVFPLGTAGTSVYDPVNNTFAAGGTGAGDPFRVGSSVSALANGKAFLPAGNTSYSSYLYDLTTGAVTSGPGMGTNSIGVGGHSFVRPDGTILIIGGGNAQSSYIYNPGSNTISAGPGVGTTVSYGGHAMQRPDGKFLVVAGNGSATALYNPTNNTFTAGPALTCTARQGSHSIQRADGTYMILCGNNTVSTVIYDPSANTMTAGLNLPFALTDGGHAFQRPDGKYVIVRGGGLNNVELYDAGYIMSGTYTTEDLNIPALTASSTLQYTAGGTGTVTVKVKTGVLQSDLSSATYTTVTSGGSINPVAGAQWAKIQVTLNRPIPLMPQAPYVWVGEDSTTYLRTLSTPTLDSLSVVN